MCSHFKRLRPIPFCGERDTDEKKWVATNWQTFRCGDIEMSFYQNTKAQSGEPQSFLEADSNDMSGMGKIPNP